MTSSLIVDAYPEDSAKKALSKAFVEAPGPRYVMGRNHFAQDLATRVNIDGFVDDFTSETTWLGKPILRTADLPRGASVLSTVFVRPFTAEQQLKKHGLSFLDYFAFRKYTDLSFSPLRFWDGCAEDIRTHLDRYEWVYSLLADGESRETMKRIVNFRLTSDLNALRGFTEAQYRQYFEDFLELNAEGEVFVDAGSFDGTTSLEFMKRCPRYEAVHVFEPEPRNMAIVKQKMASLPRVSYYQVGLSDRGQSLYFSNDGSSSCVSTHGETEVRVERLDDVVTGPVSIVKMDIEGDEGYAIDGMKGTLEMHHPRLAVSAYHRVDDLRVLTEKVLSYRDDYRVYLRHYTQGLCETVLFFVPAK